MRRQHGHQFSSPQPKQVLVYLIVMGVFNCTFSKLLAKMEHIPEPDLLKRAKHLKFYERLSRSQPIEGLHVRKDSLLWSPSRRWHTVQLAKREEYAEEPRQLTLAIQVHKDIFWLGLFDEAHPEQDPHKALPVHQHFQKPSVQEKEGQIEISAPSKKTRMVIQFSPF